MNELVDQAIAARRRSTEVNEYEQPRHPMVFAESGVIIARGDGWNGLKEAVILPLIADDDFVIQLAATLGKSIHTPPSEDPTAVEVMTYYLYQRGDLTEAWIVQIHMDDHGRQTLGDPQQLENPTIVSPGGKALHDMIRKLGSIDHPPRDRHLEAQAAAVLASYGHTVIWEGP